MPLYFFELSDGTETLEDVDGRPFPDAASARNEAISVVEVLLKRHASFFAPNWTEWDVSVKDEKKGIVFSVPFTEAYSLREVMARSTTECSSSRVWSDPHTRRPSWSSMRG